MGSPRGARRRRGLLGPLRRGGAARAAPPPAGAACQRRHRRGEPAGPLCDPAHLVSIAPPLPGFSGGTPCPWQRGSGGARRPGCLARARASPPCPAPLRPPGSPRTRSRILGGGKMGDGGDVNSNLILACSTGDAQLDKAIGQWLTWDKVGVAWQGRAGRGGRLPPGRGAAPPPAPRLASPGLPLPALLGGGAVRGATASRLPRPAMRAKSCPRLLGLVQLQLLRLGAGSVLSFAAGMGRRHQRVKQMLRLRSDLVGMSHDGLMGGFPLNRRLFLLFKIRGCVCSLSRPPPLNAFETLARRETRIRRWTGACSGVRGAGLTPKEKECKEKAPILRLQPCMHLSGSKAHGRLLNCF